MSIPKVIVLATLILASSISKDALSYSSNSLIDTLLICKNNINKLEILPTILSQNGWVEASQNTNNPVFQHLFKKSTYEIGFSHNILEDECVVRQLNLKRLPNYELKEIFTCFPFSSKQKIAVCRDYTYHTKEIEWEYENNNFVGYYTYFNDKEKLFSLTFHIKHANSGKYFSVCKMGDL